MLIVPGDTRRDTVYSHLIQSLRGAIITTTTVCCTHHSDNKSCHTVLPKCEGGGGDSKITTMKGASSDCEEARYQWRLPHLVEGSQVQQSCEALGALKQAAGDTSAVKSCNSSAAFRNTKGGF